MANLAANTLEGGTNGTAVSAANSGGASGTAFNAVSVGTAATAAYDSTRAAHGVRSLKVATGASAVDAEVQWQAAVGTQATLYARTYVWITAAPGANHRLSTMITPGLGALCSALYLNTNRTLTLIDSGGGSVLTTTTAVPTGAWSRIEWLVQGSTTAGHLELRLYTTADSGTATESLSSASNLNTGGSLGFISFGTGWDAKANVGPLWLDDIAISATGFPGPAVAGPEPGRFLLA